MRARGNKLRLVYFIIMDQKTTLKVLQCDKNKRKKKGRRAAKGTRKRRSLFTQSSSDGGVCRLRELRRRLHRSAAAQLPPRPTFSLENTTHPHRLTEGIHAASISLFFSFAPCTIHFLGRASVDIRNSICSGRPSQMRRAKRFYCRMLQESFRSEKDCVTLLV